MTDAGAHCNGWAHCNAPIRYPESAHVHPWPTGEDVIDRDLAPFRIWIPDSPLLVLGNSQDAERELRLEAAAAEGVPVYKRKGGGGAVYLGPGCVCVALRLRRRPRDSGNWGIHDYFKAGNGFVADSLRAAYGVTLEGRGISDLAWMEERHGRLTDYKLLGSSLHLPRDCALYLAVLLVDEDLARIGRLLRHPSREPDYREGRDHSEFVTNLKSVPGASAATPAAVRALLERALTEGPSGHGEAGTADFLDHLDREEDREEGREEGL